MKAMIMMLSLLSVSLVAKDLTLMETYQKELAFLMAQKRSLGKQLNKLERSYAKKMKKVEKLERVKEDQYISLTRDNERLVNNLSELERNLENASGNKELVNTTLSQAKVTLGITDKELEGLKVKSKMLEHIFARAFSTLQEGQTISKAPGEFFLADGRKQRSEVMSIGHIAKFALVDGQYGALIPVGARKFKLDRESMTSQETFVRSDVGSLAPMFIFESMEKAIEPKKEKTFMQIVKAGGLIGYVIVGLGLLALVLMCLRGFMLWQVGRYDDQVISHLNAGDLSAVEKGLESGQTSFARVLKKTLAAKDLELDKREHVINESILGELQFLDKFGSIILVMAAVAPLLGLLGTVSGMISTFDIITEFGTGDPKLLSSGISEALITTKLGLIVAIPTLLMGNLFSGWSNKIKIMLEREALRLSNFVGREA